MDGSPFDATDMLSAVPHAYVLLGTDHVIRDVSDAYLRMTGTTRDALVGRRLYDIFPGRPDDTSDALEALRESVDRVLHTGNEDRLDVFRHPLPSSDDPNVWRNHWWSVTNAPIRRDGAVIGVVHYGKDVSERHAARGNRDIFDRLATRMTTVAQWVFVPESGQTLVSEALARMYAVPWGGERADPEVYFSRYHPDDRAEAKRQFAAYGEAPTHTPVSIDHRIVLPSGEVRHISGLGEVTRRTEHEPATIIGVAVDVTDARRREEKLRDALGERDRLLAQQEKLLAEVNHRIKNSLQIIASILGIDARTARDAAARARLQSANARVLAVATVHELIYREGQVSTVEIGGYLPDLCRALGEGGGGTTIACEAEPMRMSTDSAISLALLVNELVGNALEHAFPDGRRGRVAVSLRAHGDRLHLRVHDDGVGKAPHGGTGLGTRLISGMVEQLGGTLRETAARPGHDVRVDIPLAARA